MSSASFTRLAIVAAGKRAPLTSSNKRGVAVAYLSGLKVTPLDPLTREIRERSGTRAPIEGLQCMIDAGPDIEAGDYLVVDSIDYSIRDVISWAWRGSICKVLVLEKIKP